MLRVAEILIRLVSETLRWLRLSVRANMSVKAENLFLQVFADDRWGTRPTRCPVQPLPVVPTAKHPGAGS